MLDIRDILTALRDQPGQTCGELADALGTTQSKITSRMTRLSRQGYTVHVEGQGYHLRGDQE